MGWSTARIGFGGEESAGASFLRRDGTVWTTDKDGIIACLLAAEMTARGGRDPGVTYADLTERFGNPSTGGSMQRRRRPRRPRSDGSRPMTSARPRSPEMPINGILTTAPGNGAAIGGLKVTTENGWFAARPSGTENVYKIYAESFRGDEHLERLIEEAQSLVAEVLQAT